MLQNRVDPYGQIISTPARGSWTGNRGILHDEAQQLQRLFALKAWITCLLSFKGRKRQLMAPHRYTELFFMDEATAFSAGHRPCFECRRKDFLLFKTCWIRGNPQYGFNEKTPVHEIDKILHRERIDPSGNKIVFEEAVKNIPAGSFIEWEGRPFLLAGKLLYGWSSSGYAQGISLPKSKKLRVLTPRSVINAFGAGYLPEMKT
jgi:hypothetical protein